MHTLRAAAPRRSASLTGLFPNLSTSQANDHRQLANHTQTAHRPGNYPPQRKDLLGGLKFTRRFSHNEVHPYDEVDWTRRDVRIMDWKTGKTIYERLGLEAPAHWDDNAVKITADKYLFGSEPGSLEYEDSFRNIYDRISNTYTVWGWEEGYFATLEDAEIFNEEIKAMLVQQIWAPNSPVWFNIGHWEQWRWGRPDLRESYTGHGNKAYHTKGTKNNLKTFTVQSTYEYPQCSACFLTEVGDSMEDILDHLTTEGRIFASGSGVGINLSTLRSSKEPISGKGRSSGPISFDRGWDRMAGAIKSGGKTRRAARMVLMFSDHPDIFRFINTKNRQEDIAKVILREHNVHVELKQIAETKLVAGTPAEKAAARVILSLPLATRNSFDPHMDALLYGETLSHQNANHSVSLKGISGRRSPITAIPTRAGSRIRPTSNRHSAPRNFWKPWPSPSGTTGNPACTITT